MAAYLSYFSAESAKSLCDQVNRSLRGYESSHVNVQVITTVVPDNRTQSGSRVLYEAFITHPASVR